MNIINPKSFHSNEFNLAQISYQIQFFVSQNISILPSDLTLYYKLHISCFIEINNSININSFPIIESNKYFKCKEFAKLHENIQLGFVIYETEDSGLVKKGYILYYISQVLFKYSYENDYLFDKFRINNEYLILSSKNNKNHSLTKLRKLYISEPILKLKRDSVDKENRWNFKNIFNQYYCFCKGFNCLNIISKKCKYYFYIYLIDINQNVYKKTDYLLLDFIFKKYSSDDVYPIFDAMI